MSKGNDKKPKTAAKSNPRVGLQGGAVPGQDAGQPLCQEAWLPNLGARANEVCDGLSIRMRVAVIRSPATWPAQVKPDPRVTK